MGPEQLKKDLGVPDVNFGAAGFGSAFQLNDPTTNFGFRQTYGPQGPEQVGVDFNRRYPGGNFSGSATAGQSGVEGFNLGAAQNLPGGHSLSERYGMQFGPEGPNSSLGLGGRFLPYPGLSLGTDFNMSLGPTGQYGFSGDFSSGFRSDPFAFSMGAHGFGNNNDSGGRVGASSTMQLMPGLYGNAFGNYGDSAAGDPNYFAGGGLTYMPSSHLGLTAGGGFGSQGWEGRLQADYFKDGVGGAGALEDQRKRAMVSGYLGVSGGGGSGMNDQYGTGDVSKQFNAGGTTFTAGVGVNF